MTGPEKGGPAEIKAAALYTTLSAARQTVLDRARKASALTIPGLIPEEGQNEHSSFEQPYQSLGARCVSNLSSALLLALFPPNLPFFRLTVDEGTAASLGEDLGTVNGQLSVLARTVYSLMEGAGLRPTMIEAIRHLVVAGNVLAFAPDGGKAARLFRLDQFVIRRDASGALTQAVIRERVYPSSLEESVRVAAGIATASETEMVDLYTVILRDGDQVTWRQEVKDVVIPGSMGSAPASASPWIALRWLTVPGSDYGRSHVTEYIGDFLSLEDLYKAMVQFAAVAARIIHLVDPNSGIDIEELAEAQTGDYIHGLADRVTTLSLEKYNDWRVMADLAERLEQRLSAAFLLRTGVTRDAERVTAEEVRLVAQELENILGGTYTVLSAEMQLPLVRRYLHVGERLNKVPALPKSVTPSVVTGFDALGRAHGTNRLRAFLADMQSAGLNIVEEVNTGELARRLGDGHGVDGLDDLLKTPEQKAQEAQARQAAAMAEKVAPQIAGAAGEAALGSDQE
jgi:hypothetical protein